MWERNPPAFLTATRADAAGLLASLAPAAQLDTSPLASVEAAEPQHFDLGDVVLVERELEHEDRLGLGPLDLLGPAPLRGPPPSYPETRVRGFELLPPFRVGASPSLSLWPRQACGFSCREVVSDSRYDPWGLAVKVAPGTYDYREQGEAAKEDLRYLGWLASSPASAMTDYNQRRELLTTAGNAVRHAAGWVFNRPVWDLAGIGMTGLVKIPGAVGKVPQLSRVVEGIAAGERSLVPPLASTIEKVGAAPAGLSAETPARVLEYFHRLKPNKVTDVAELEEQVQRQVSRLNELIRDEGMKGVKDRILRYRSDPSVERAGRSYVRSLEQPADDLAWLHEPDMSVGGAPGDVTARGSRRINSIIGGNSKRLANEILSAPDDVTRFDWTLILEEAPVRR